MVPQRAGVALKADTPMMAQYKALKEKHKDAILFFRLGDFYEMFFEDALVASQILDIALTARTAGRGEKAPMCGVPHHAADDYIKLLVESGHKVAICEQVEDPAVAKGLVERDVVRIITPGTYWEGAEPGGPSYIAAVCMDEDMSAGLCACDVSTGEVLLGWATVDEDEGLFRTKESVTRRLANEVSEEMCRLFVKECVLPDTPGGYLVGSTLGKALPDACLTYSQDPEVQDGLSLADGAYGKGYGETLLGKVPYETAFRALSKLFAYLEDTQKIRLSHLKEPRLYLQEGFLEIDGATRRNLELLSRLSGGFQGSLAWTLDRCCTSMGSRLLKAWTERPLKDAVEINRRLDGTEDIYSDSTFRGVLRDKLSRVKDLERLVTKITYESANGRDLVSLASSLEIVPEIKKLLSGRKSTLLRELEAGMDPVSEAVESIREALVDEPPLSVTSGGMVREGYNQEIDALRDLAEGGHKWVLDLETREKERTGIKSLKVGYNRVFGYYIEVSKANLSLVPDDYIRKQTLVSAERYITPELKEKETSILGAREKLHKEEYAVFCEVREGLKKHLRRIQKTAAAVGTLDVLSSFAEVSATSNYVKPDVKPLGTGGIHIVGGRHPVLDKLMPPGTFVPNDLTLDDKQRTLIITGPNMGGKSTYCRQAALILIMAQMGCFVPATSCTLSCADKVFARVGAYDDLVLGQSTFMVEMTEVSRIVERATPNSLVVLDEIGRGTSTFDGLSVAWAVLEHLCDPKVTGVRGLVATHYRELTLLADLKPGIANYHVSVKKTGDEVIFLRKTVRGVAEGSFGIEVAAMAGLPRSVVERAKEILSGLETESRRGARFKTGILGQTALRSSGGFVPGQASLFGGEGAASKPSLPKELSELLETLKSLDADNMTPRDALNKLFDLKEKARSVDIDGGEVSG